MRRLAGAAALVAVGAASGAAVVPPAPAALCSEFGFDLPKPDAVGYIIGRATDHTQYAGPGTIRYQARPVHDEGVFFRGLWIEVEQAHARVDGFPARGDSILVVPWGRGAACEPTPRGGRGQFVPVGHRAFYRLALRDRAYWVDGRPTADLQVGGGGRLYAADPSRRSPRDSLFSAEDALDLHRAAPWRSEVEAEGFASLDQFRQWLKPRESRLGEVWWVRYATVDLARSAEQAVVERLRPEMAGTWRLTFELPAGGRLEHYVRSGDRPRRAARVSHLPPPDAASPLERARIWAPQWKRLPRETRFNGFDLPFWDAPTEDKLPIDGGWASRDRDTPWGMAIVREPEFIRGEAVWIARRDPNEWWRMTDNAELSRFAEAHRKASRDPAGAETELGAEVRFTKAPSGEWRLVGAWRVGDQVLRLRGERVSDATISPLPQR